jgi:signal transduction histidine kinase
VDAVTVEVDVETFLSDIFMRWSGTAPRSWHLGPVPSGTVRVDTEAMRAALDALIENAVKHTEENQPIEISAIALGDDLVIEIADRGPGVPADAIDRIFDRFARGDDARSRATGGAGLGLAIVRAVAEAHGGTASVRTRRGGGASFLLRVPGLRPLLPPQWAPARAAEATA